MKTIKPQNVARNRTRTILSASGCPFCMGGFQRSSSKSWGRLNEDHTASATMTPMNNQARHHSNVPAGNKSRPPKKAIWMMMPTINLKMNMCALPLYNEARLCRQLILLPVRQQGPEYPHVLGGPRDRGNVVPAPLPHLLHPATLLVS